MNQTIYNLNQIIYNRSTIFKKGGRVGKMIENLALFLKLYIIRISGVIYNEIWIIYIVRIKKNGCSRSQPEIEKLNSGVRVIGVIKSTESVKFKLANFYKFKGS